ncbi:S8 family peptidase [Ligilactobacillus cholophilus]|uniref:S8 family peptidase n=1 Tax=Ligilactobacillus cholophilus TaxID=3050131 RepID=UPI0025B223B6|nr:S8 family serine peptidase [Ligilactobacillus cholophilus]
MKKIKLILLSLFCTFLFSNYEVDANQFNIITDNYNQTLSYLQSNHMTIKTSIPEIGYIETDGSLTKEQIRLEDKNIKCIEDTVNQTDPDLFGDSVVAQPEPNYLPKLFSYQWGMNRITNSGKSYRINHNNRKLINVAIIDSGIDTSHEAFKGSIDFKHSENLVPAGGYDNTEPEEKGNKDNLQDFKGHGTAVAGQVSANGQIYGVSPGAELQIYRVFGKSKSKESWVLRAIIDAVNNGADIINLSLGQYVKLPQGNFFNSADAIGYKLALDYAERHNVIVVSAVGNDGIGEDPTSLKKLYEKENGTVGNLNYQVIDLPACLNNTIAVGSSDNNNRISSFSNHFNKYDSHFVLAPGGGTELLNKYGEKKWYEDKLFMQESILSTSNDGNYNYFNGTSVSTGKVSGELAEIMSTFGLKERPWAAKYILLNKTTTTNDGYKEINVYSALGGN